MIALLLLLAPAVTMDITVSETAGIRRFGYPVSVKLTLKDDLTGKEQFRLFEGGKAMVAQFRPVGKREVWLDFNVSIGPREKRALTVDYRPDVAAGLELKAGVSVKEEKGAFEVRHGGLLFTVPAGLDGLLGEVRGGKLEYMKPGSKGLWVETGKGRSWVKGLKGKVSRSGPMAAALGYAGKAGEAKVSVDLTFPLSKSWVEVNVQAEGPVTALGADLKLLLTSPALVDFGAGTNVYVALKKDETAALHGYQKFKLGKVRAVEEYIPTWTTLVGKGKDLRPYVVAPEKGGVAEGWAHAMDRQRCTAVAVERFGRAANELDKPDEIAVDADGGLRVRAAGTKRLRFWLHFVPMPVHVGAVTSPQSMMAPLAVTVTRP